MFYTFVSKKGFTFVELLIVATLLLFLLALAVPFVTSVRADVSLMRTAKQVKTDLLASLAYGAGGKSFAALSANDLLNPQLIPSHYALHFTVTQDVLDPLPYDYLELRHDSKQASTQQLYKMEKPWESPGAFLKSISLKANPEAEGKSVSSAWLVFIPPFSKVVLLAGETLANLDTLPQQIQYQQIELEFGYKDQPQTQLIRFDVGKTLSVI